MSFDATERARFGGKPVHLFVFTRQSLVWRFNGGTDDLLISGNTYLTAPIKRSEIQQTIEPAKDTITITLPYLRDPAASSYPVTQSLGDTWHPYVPSDAVQVVCMATHVGSADAPVVEWMGVVTQPKFEDGLLTLTCEPSSGLARARNQGPRWQRACWKTVYTTGLRGCNLDRDVFATPGTLTAASGLTVTATEFAASALPLAGGYLTWTRSDGLLDRRTIMAHSGDTLTLLYGAADLAAGLAVTARPGCERTWAACNARSNTLNFGGAIYKPVDNPTDGVSMSWG